jgi:hypothetical protein
MYVISMAKPDCKHLDSLQTTTSVTDISVCMSYLILEFSRQLRIFPYGRVVFKS